MSASGLLHLLFSFFVLQANAACPLFGCDSAQQNTLRGFAPQISAQPKIAWKTNLSHSSGDKLVCTSSEETAVCTVNSGDQYTANGRVQPGVFALGSSGSVKWNSSSILATRSAPLQGTVEGGGLEIIVTDGKQLVAFDAAGASLGPAISLHSDKEAYGLTLTDNGVVLVADKACELAGYLTNGVIHASMRFRANIAGVDGCFAPLSMPAVNSTLNRVYIATQFDQPLSKTNHLSKTHRLSKNSSGVTVCRIYAVDIHRTMDNRMQTAWTSDYRCRRNSGTNVPSQDPPLLLLNGTLYFESAGSGSSSSSFAPHLFALSDDGDNSTVLFATPLPPSGKPSGKALRTAALPTQKNASAYKHAADVDVPPVEDAFYSLHGLSLVTSAELDLHTAPRMLWVALGGSKGSAKSANDPMHTHSCTHTHTPMHTPTHSCTHYTPMHTPPYTHTSIHTHLHTYTPPYTH
jgi:hypothetical protein